MNSKLDIGIIFLFNDHAIVFAIVTPILTPVKDPGPVTTNILLIEFNVKFDFFNPSSICFLLLHDSF